MAIPTPKLPAAIRDVQGIRGLDNNLRNLLQAMKEDIEYVYGVNNRNPNPAIFLDRYNQDIVNAPSTSPVTDKETIVYSDYEVKPTDGLIVVDATAEDIDITLPSFSGNQFLKLRIIRIDNQGDKRTVRVKGVGTDDGREEISGNEFINLERKYYWLEVQAASFEWLIFGRDDGLSAQAEEDLTELRSSLFDSQEAIVAQLKLMNLYLAEMLGDLFKVSDIEE